MYRQRCGGSSPFDGTKELISSLLSGLAQSYLAEIRLVFFLVRQEMTVRIGCDLLR
jgi:hypothetical protein